MDPNELYEKLKESLKTGNLIIIEGLIIVLLLIILFTAVDFGSLFQGFSAVDLGPQDVTVEGQQQAQTLEYESRLEVSYLNGQSSDSATKNTVLDFRYPFAQANFIINNPSTGPQLKIKELRIKTLKDKQIFKFQPANGSERVRFYSGDLNQIGIEKPVSGPHRYELDLFYEGSEVKTVAKEFEIFMPGAPTIKSTTPKNNATDVPTTSNAIEIFFNQEGLSLGANASATLTKQGETTNILSANALVYNTTKKSLVISHNALEKGEAYTLNVKRDSVLNLNQALPSDFTLRFATLGEKNVTPPPSKSPTPKPTNTTPPPTTSQSPQISNSKVSPNDFNPLIKATKITYTLSKKAKVEIRIVDKNGNTVVKLLDNKEKDATTHEIWWNGTDKTTSVGKTVPAGTYSYKIIIRDPATNAITDSKSGTIKATYNTPDFENQTPKTTTATTANTSNTPDPVQAKAIQTLQNTKTGKTAETGPSVLLYTLFPLSAYFIRRKK